MPTPRFDRRTHVLLTTRGQDRLNAESVALTSDRKARRPRGSPLCHHDRVPGDGRDDGRRGGLPGLDGVRVVRDVHGPHTPCILEQAICDISPVLARRLDLQEAARSNATSASAGMHADHAVRRQRDSPAGSTHLLRNRRSLCLAQLGPQEVDRRASVSSASSTPSTVEASTSPSFRVAPSRVRRRRSTAARR